MKWCYLSAQVIQFYLHPLQEWLLRFLHLVPHLRNDLLILLIEPVHKTYGTIYITNCDSDMIDCFHFISPTTLFFSLLIVTKVIETSSITFYLTYFLIRSSCWLNLIFAFTTLMPYPINPPIIAGKIQPNPTSCIGRNLVNTWLTTSMLTPGT